MKKLFILILILFITNQILCNERNNNIEGKNKVLILLKSICNKIYNQYNQSYNDWPKTTVICSIIAIYFIPTIFRNSLYCSKEVYKKIFKFIDTNVSWCLASNNYVIIQS